MSYKIAFYISLIIFLFHSITGNVTMADVSFKGLVILGFLSIFSLVNYPNRR